MIRAALRSPTLAYMYEGRGRAQMVERDIRANSGEITPRTCFLPCKELWSLGRVRSVLTYLLDVLVCFSAPKPESQFRSFQRLQFSPTEQSIPSPLTSWGDNMASLSFVLNRAELPWPPVTVVLAAHFMTPPLTKWTAAAVIAPLSGFLAGAQETGRCQGSYPASRSMARC